MRFCARSRYIDCFVFNIYAVFTIAYLGGMLHHDKTSILVSSSAAAAFVLIFMISIALQCRIAIGPRTVYAWGASARRRISGRRYRRREHLFQAKNVLTTPVRLKKKRAPIAWRPNPLEERVYDDVSLHPVSRFAVRRDVEAFALFVFGHAQPDRHVHDLV